MRQRRRRAASRLPAEHGAAVGKLRVDVRAAVDSPCRSARAGRRARTVSPPAFRLRSEKLPSICGARKRSRAVAVDLRRSERDVLVDDVGRRPRDGRRLRAALAAASAISARSMPLASTRNSGATFERSGETTVDIAGEKPSAPSVRSPESAALADREDKVVEHARAALAGGKLGRAADRRAAERAADLRLAGRLRARRRCRRSAPWRRRAAGPSARLLAARLRLDLAARRASR